MHEAFRYQAIDWAGDVNRRDSGNRLSTVGHHQLVASCDPSEVPAQVIAQVSNAHLHWGRSSFVAKSVSQSIATVPFLRAQDIVGRGWSRWTAR